MLLLDDDKDIARKYKITFEGQNKIHAVRILTEVLKNPIIVSREEKKGVATDLVEQITSFEINKKDIYHSSIIEKTTQNIRQISEYVRISDIVTLIKKFEYPFVIGFIATHLSDSKNFLNELDSISSTYVKILLESFRFHSYENLNLLLLPYCNTKFLEEISRYLINDQEQILSLPEIQLFRQVFSYTTLTEEFSWLAPFSVSDVNANSCYYEEAERDIIENAALEVQTTDLFVKKLYLKPFKKNRTLHD